MYIEDLTTDGSVLAELGRRLAQHRREHNWTQAAAAAEAGLGQATLQRIERGQSVQMTSMVKLLRALGLLKGLDIAVPEAVELPIQRLERMRRVGGSRRVRHGRRELPAQEPGRQPWRWGDETA
jgi:transcriptional regulator with XRE-family HTH domain